VIIASILASLRPRALTALEKISVLEAARLSLRQRQAEGDEEEFRDAITAGFMRRGWWFANYGSQRERSLLLDIADANGFEELSVEYVERFTSTKTTQWLCSAISVTILYLQKQ
jgi:hypothetical protein